MANAITVRQIYTCAAEIITLSDNRWQMKKNNRREEIENVTKGLTRPLSVDGQQYARII